MIEGLRFASEILDLLVDVSLSQHRDELSDILRLPRHKHQPTPVEVDAPELRIGEGFDAGKGQHSMNRV